MSNNYTCPICEQQTTLKAVGKQIPQSTCKNCGDFFEITDTFIYFEVIRDKKTKTKVSGWIADQNRNGIVPYLSREALERASARPLPTVVERAERLLLTLLQHQSKLGASFEICEIPRLLAATYSESSNELSYLVNFLIKRDWLVTNSTNKLYQVAPDGHIEADRLTRKITQESKAFVAMSFDRELDIVYEKGFQAGILKAGYEPFRIDEKEHTDKIDDQIIAELKTSAFVVADFTKHRGGVYFEAGFGLGMNLPVIWTCNNNDKGNLHFDIRQYNMIFWDENKYEELALRLQHRIEAIVGKGPNEF